MAEAVPPVAFAHGGDSPELPRARCRSEQSDAALLAAFAVGDHEAFAAIAARHGGMVFRVCLRRLGNVHDAEDATQAVFWQLARAPGRAMGSLGGWLHKVAGDVALMALRARARRGRHEGEAAMRKVSSRPSSEGSLREELDHGIARLPARLREAVILCYLEGHKQEDAARILGCSQGTLSRWANDGLERLRALLTGRGVAVSSAVLLGFLAQQKAAAVPAGLLGTLGAVGAGKAALSAQAAALAQAAGKAALIAKVKVAAAVVAAVAVVGAGVATVLRPAAVEPQVTMKLLDFDGSAPPVNPAGEGFPKPCHEPGNTDPGGWFTTFIEPSDAVAGRSLRMRLTQGRFKAHFTPEGLRGRKFFARDLAADPSGWRFNTYNRLRLWIKLPRTSPPHSLTGGSNMNLGTNVRRVRDADEHSLTAGGGTYAHRVNVPAVGEWAQVIFNAHPCLANGDEQAVPSSLPHPTGEPGYNYFDALTHFYLEARGAPARYPADYLLDEMEFYQEARPENDAQVHSVAAVHVSAENRVLVTWNRRPGEDTVAHEVRYAFEDIHRLGWAKAVRPPDGKIVPPGQGTKIGMVYDSRALPLAGRKLLYLALKPENSEVFTQVAVPLDLKR